MALPWNHDADKQLKRLVKKYTSKKGTNWKKVASHFPARTPKACEGRYHKIQGKLTEATPDGTDHPTYQELFEKLRDNPMTLEAIANHFDRSPAHIRDKLNKMQESRYNLIIGKNTFAVQTSTAPQAAPRELEVPRGRSLAIAIASDWHVGSKWAQPTSLNQFIQLAYEDYGVRHMMVPGDPTDGAYVYGPRHLDNLIPQVRPLNRKRVWQTAEAQVQLADAYAPKLDGLTYYVMGGNHDRTIISESGMDPIRMLCDRREDMHYGGYDVWSVRLTEKSYIRLMHPSGGVAYARSYKLQKGIENLAFEALQQAMVEEAPPMTSVLAMGHYHLTNHSPEPPMHGVLAGCFQGQTPYLKAKNLVPHVAGIILELEFEKYGRLSQVAHRPIYFEEILDDWKSWPLPSVTDPEFVPDELGVLFSFTGDEPVVEVPKSEDN